ncbi:MULTISPECIES: rhodanese-like domain-containing protein [unclassified Streptomyces]|uniref:sulfurtransferase n=1 Tax=unclassified Streptomyces TaxID=2593676 RepID=UPI002E800E6C|nr:rhodanese-like domain-containing protein [Streptomyces sp. NBC_00589]WTI39721.1 rhodanese-like domain-containing protein [Streptomyces sp. NBC_00775]WUB26600.1 rhodanese-like domain-containing protein [Streptomyces sp. NBC_00589]
MNDALLPGPLVDDAWLAARLDDPRLVVLDATALLPSPRHDGDYRSGSGHDRWAEGHIPGSRHADLTCDLSDHTAPYHFAVPAPEALAAALGRLGVHDGTEVVAYDSGGGIWAARLWWMLRSISVRAAVLDGGLEAWEAAGRPVVTGEMEPAPEVPGAPGASTVNTLTPVPLPHAWATLTEVDAVRRGERPGTLVCALPTPGFDGSAPTRYSRRGHIPGSLSLPGRGLLDDAGRFLPRDELAARVGAVLDESASPVVLYCGGGISAAGAALALTLLGREDITLYDGSLEEWSADPELPLVQPG